ncbi:MAG: hypothetical protein JSW02_07805 [candidate division WOR-3 bacterium]|nr:MAG: hypothetical protein JSW02_07805 [candidate division WOR-3 bacterium]
MKRQLILLSALIIVAIATTGCSRKTLLQKIDEGDLSSVYQGRYTGTTRFLRDGAEYKETVDMIRREIEAHEDLLMVMTGKYFPVDRLRTYKFKFAMVDETQGELILRYFARLPDHPVFAGCQLQFVYDLDAKQLTKIFTSEVPLE